MDYTMDKQMENLFEKLKIEMQTQLQTQTENLTEKFNSKLDEKIQPLLEDNIILKNKVETLESKVQFLEKELRKNNLVLHGIQENEVNQQDLMEIVLKVLNDLSEKTNMEVWDRWEINMVRRLGKKGDGRTRPILISLTLNWRKFEILKNNKSFPENTYATEDMPKEVLIKRKELKKTVEEEKAKGNLAYIRYDKIVIKEIKPGETKNRKEMIHAEKRREEKRKRMTSKSPNTVYPPISKVNKVAVGEMSRARSFSITEIPKL